MRFPEGIGAGRRSMLLSIGGGECPSGVGGRLEAHRDLLEKQVAVDIVEGGKQHDPLQEGLEVVVPLVQPPLECLKQGYDSRSVIHALHLVAVVVRIEVALDEGKE
jgi:hypothetical protein